MVKLEVDTVVTAFKITLDFDKGDIGVSLLKGANGRKPCVGFAPIPKHTPGADVDPALGFGNRGVVMRFHNLDSLDTVLMVLKRARKNLKRILENETESNLLEKELAQQCCEELRKAIDEEVLCRPQP